jgi:hypothetical protein
VLTPASRIAILGYGGGGALLAAALAPRGCAVRVFDTRLAKGGSGARLRGVIEAAGLDACDQVADALHGARLVVLEDPALAAAALSLLRPGQSLLELRVGGASRPDPASAEGVARVRGRFTAGSLDLLGGRAPALAIALRELGVAARAVNRLPQGELDDEPAPRLPDTMPAVARAELP